MKECLKQRKTAVMAIKNLSSTVKNTLIFVCFLIAAFLVYLNMMSRTVSPIPMTFRMFLLNLFVQR